MVKEYNQQLKKQQINQEEKLAAKATQIQLLRRTDLIKDTKRYCLKNSKAYNKPKLNLNEYIYAADKTHRLPKEASETDREVHSYKVALKNTEQVLTLLQNMKVKNQRPHDYLVEMYKSDKQMFKVRRHLTQKEEKFKEKMQGKDWESKNKRKEKMKKKAQVKRERKREKTRVKREKINMGRPKMTKVNGKNKTKKIKN